MNNQDNQDNLSNNSHDSAVRNGADSPLLNSQNPSPMSNNDPALPTLEAAQPVPPHSPVPPEDNNAMACKKPRTSDDSDTDATETQAEATSEVNSEIPDTASVSVSDL